MWRGSAFEEVLRTETDYEGVNEPVVPSENDSSHVPVHQLRDTAIYEEHGRVHLFYLRGLGVGDCAGGANYIRRGEQHNAN